MQIMARMIHAATITTEIIAARQRILNSITYPHGLKPRTAAIASFTFGLSLLP